MRDGRGTFEILPSPRDRRLPWPGPYLNRNDQILNRIELMTIIKIKRHNFFCFHKIFECTQNIQRTLSDNQQIIATQFSFLRAVSRFTKRHTRFHRSTFDRTPRSKMPVNDEKISLFSEHASATGISLSFILKRTMGIS